MYYRTRFKVLVVDDCNMTRMMLDRYLTNLGFTVFQACDYETAMDQICLGEIHLVVSDVQMPGQSGVELLKATRLAYSDLPFYLFSGCARLYESEAVASGVTRILEKSRVGDLIGMIEAFYCKSFLPKVTHAH